MAELTREEAIALTKQGGLAFKSKNYAAAVPALTKASEYGIAQAQYLLAGCYMNGWGVEKNYETALLWARKARDGGMEAAGEQMVKPLEKALSGVYFKRGYAALEAKNQEAAYSMFKKGAEAGSVESMYNLGIMLSQTTEKEKNQEAVYWFTCAAERGDKNAQNRLGQVYDPGLDEDFQYSHLGVGIKDKDKAISWYLKAAEQGHGDAAFRLYFMRVHKDGNQYYWLEKAAEFGDRAAQMFLGMGYDDGGSFGREKDIDKAIYWYTKAAEQGDKDAQIKLTSIYEITKNDPVKAEYWRKRYQTNPNKTVIEKFFGE